MKTKQKSYTSNKKKSSKKYVVLLAALIVVGAAAGGAFAWHRHHNQQLAMQKAKDSSDVRPQNTVDYSPGTKADNQANENRKDSGSTSTTTLDTNPSSPAPTFSVTVTGANVVNGNMQVSTLVNGTTSGTCTVTFTQSGQTNVTATNQVTLQNNSYVCPNFEIPLSQFPTGGAWNVSVSVVNGGQTVTGQWAANPVTINK